MMKASSQWQPTKLDELGFVGRGKSRHRPRNAAFLYGGRYPFFQTGDIKAANFYLTEYSQTYSEEGLAQSKLWKPGTLCITIAANIAESAILGIEGCFPDSVVGFVANQEKADVRFIKYYLEILKLRMQNISHGATQDNLSLDKLLSFDFLIPPLPIQRRIAGILSAYDELIENSQRRIKILEAMARALYREWFVHFRFPGHESVPRVPSPLGDIPQGWEVRKLADFVTTKYGYTESTNVEPVGPKYLRGMDINKSSFIDWSQVPYCPISQDDHETYRLKVGDVLVIRMADPGKVGIVEQEVDAVFASYLIRVAPKDERLSPYFLFYLMESAEYYAFITGASTGTTRKSASAGVIADYQFFLPPQKLVEQFERRVSEIRSLLTILLKTTVNLRRTRDLLLPRLLSGQVELALSNSKETNL
jgi:type I restriction enzyme S subunit